MSTVHSTDRQCLFCGITFRPDPSQVKRGKGTCCGVRCASKLPRRPLTERFWKKVRKTDSCWIWVGGSNSYGYGNIWNSGRKVLASHVSWELHNGPIPEGLCVLHNCPGGDNPICVNPAHLFLGTKAVNNSDRAQKGRNRDQRGEKNSTSRLTAQQVIEIRRRIAAGEIQRNLATEYGVHYCTISDIKVRKIWKHV